MRTLLFAVGLATGLVVPAASAASAAGCQAPLTQRMDGRISGCLRIGPLRPGVHTVVVLQVPMNSAAVPSPRGKRLPKPLPPPREPAVRVTLSPTSGPPGTVVTITGRAHRLLRRQLYADACWDGCADGLQYGGAGARRLSAHVFRLRIVVPDAPWVQGGPDRVAPLVSGDYLIGVQCLFVARGCDGRSEGAATFHLLVRHPVAWCRTGASCARLRVTPAAGMPADVVRVSGFAPLVSVTGARQPFVFEDEVLRGPPRGPEVVFRPRRDEVTFGHAALRVKAPPAFASLRPSSPLGMVSAGLPLLSANPIDPATVAWCGSGAVHVGTATIPTASAATELRALGYESAAAPPCATVAVVDPSPDSLAVAAAFSVAPAPVGGPPFYAIPLVSYDRGMSWSPIPPPPGSSRDGFGGFRYRDGAVQAVFAAQSRGGTPSYPVFDPARPLSVLATAGRSWTPAPLGCPSSGPCLELGPYLPGNCAMNGVEQPLLRSDDGGVSWSVASPSPVQACGEAELVSESPREALLVVSQSPYSVLATRDGGASWHDIGLPRFPHAGQFGAGGLTVLSNGSVLLAGDTGYAHPWMLLAPGARRWCAVRTPAPALQRLQPASPVTVIGSELWWLTAPPADFTQTAAHEVAQAALTC